MAAWAPPAWAHANLLGTDPEYGANLDAAPARVVVRYDYDMLGRRMRQDSMEAGTRWTLLAIDSQPIRAWDSRGFSRQLAYDALRRPTRLFGRFHATYYGSCDLKALMARAFLRICLRWDFSRAVILGGFLSFRLRFTT